MKFCQECGAKLNEGVKFCGECGTKVNVQSNEKDKIVFEEKLHSEDYIKRVLEENKVEGLTIIPDIPDNVLVNASASIAKNIDPRSIIALMDNSFLSNGKQGVLFTGTDIYISSSSGESIRIPLKDVQGAKYVVEEPEIEKEVSKNEIHKLVIEYSNDQYIKVGSEEIGNKIPYKLLETLLNNIKENVNKISNRNKLVSLMDMDNEIIILYFRIIIAYLKDDDGIIDSSEYKELVYLMSKLKVSKDIANELRKYRFDSIETESIDELLVNLKIHLENDNHSVEDTIDALGMNILGMHSDQLDMIHQNQTLIKMLDRLDMDDKKVKFTINNIKADKKLIENKIDDERVKETASELVAVAGGAGISLGALAITGMVGGMGASVSGGLISLGLILSSGGLFLSLAAITTAGFGVYKGIKYFSGTGQAEKFGIRIEVLTERINQLRISTSYILEDINWLNDKIYKIAVELRDSEKYTDELMEELEILVAQNLSIGDASVLIENDEHFTEEQLIISRIPEVLDIGKYNELLSKEVKKIHFDNIIKKAYLVSEDLDNHRNTDTALLREDIDARELEDVEKVLGNIGYFDTKSASIAQGKSLAKKGFSGLKKSLFSNGEGNE